MSRFRRVVHGVASGYGVMVTTAFFGLASVPLALHYLSKEQFGLWALMSSIGMYLGLVDLGMSGSVARLLIDHKDDRQTGAYGGLFKTGWLVLLVQGTLVFLAGYLLAPGLCRVLQKIPPGLQADFVALMRWQSAVLGFGFATRIFSHLLNAHQRVDVFNYSQIIALVMQFVVLWGCFEAGQGVFSLVWGAAVGAIGCALVCLVACWHLRFVPAAGAWGRASWRCFREVFGYGTDMFLVAVGTQLILASQSLIITRCLGLEVAAAWNVGTRAYTLVCQALWRIFDFSSPALSEMIVRGERVRLRQRFQALVVLSAALSGVAAIVFALCNGTFVSVFTHGKFSWAPFNDVLLGVWMIVLAILHCHGAFVLLTKQIGFMKYIYFIEGLVFVAAALLLAPLGGLPAVILCSVVCSTCFSGAYSVWRMSRYFEFPLREIALEWQVSLARVVMWFAPAALVWWLGSEWLTPILQEALSNSAAVGREPRFLAGVARLLASALFGGALGACLFLRIGLPPALQTELLTRAPKRINPLLRRMFCRQAA